MRKAPREHWVAQNERMLGWGFSNRGESLPCSFLEENQPLAQAPSSMGFCDSIFPGCNSSLFAGAQSCPGLGQYPCAGAVQTGISTPLLTDTAPLAGTCPPQVISSFTLQKNLSTCPLQITSVYLKNPCSLSLTDYLRFYPQNVNFAPGNYLDCTGMKIQWATFTLSPICSFWP